MLPQCSHGAKALGALSALANGADPICPKAIEAYHVPFDDYLIADKAVDRLVALDDPEGIFCSQGQTPAAQAQLT